MEKKSTWQAEKSEGEKDSYSTLLVVSTKS